MSELQMSLLGIGIVVVLLIYIFSLLQQHRYSQTFRKTFKQDHADILYTPSEQMPSPVADPVPATDIPAHTSAVPAPSPKISHVAAVESGCALLSDATDYLAEMHLQQPAGIEVLAALWSRRFDFGHAVYVCGLNVNGNVWEKIVAENTATYAAFKLALQLVNRSGAVSEAKLIQFKEMVNIVGTEVQAELILPDVKLAVARAAKLDEFCVSVDRIVGLNLLPEDRQHIPGAEVAKICEQHGMRLQADGAFHLLDKRGNSLCSLGNIDNTPFQYHTVQQRGVSGLTLLLDVPLTEQAVQHFDQMAELAHEIGNQLNATLVDDHRKILSPESIALIRKQVAAIESKMLAAHVAPGGAQARRLFS